VRLCPEVGVSDMWTAIALSELRRTLMLAVIAAVLLTSASGFGAQPNRLPARQARNATVLRRTASRVTPRSRVLF
jgi:hypothetical protein